MVVAGDLQLNAQSSTGQRRGVEKLVVHEQFNLSTLQNDVALLTVRYSTISTITIFNDKLNYIAKLCCYSVTILFNFSILLLSTYSSIQFCNFIAIQFRVLKQFLSYKILT